MFLVSPCQMRGMRELGDAFYEMLLFHDDGCALTLMDYLVDEHEKSFSRP